MNLHDFPAGSGPAARTGACTTTDLLSPLLERDHAVNRPATDSTRIGGVVIGELIALDDDRVTPLVRFVGQVGTAAVRARSSVDLQGPDIGSSVVLMFEHSDPARPVVVGVLREAVDSTAEAGRQAPVELDVDGHRMIVSARDQLVLRCGEASITLTKAGKVLIEGTYLLSRSSGVNRVKGGSVQLN